ncbi:unnamed protein product [Rotaria socialis]|uniref:VCBS repeat-containing protein n=1 Tax=Rotaria socialis TaxID=392032 RepID=A0A819A411_9BILA|nr:unnamed protein product [Rotaria socialis]CAF4656626.1 unnamed protein product [Rotaria socialis]
MNQIALTAGHGSRPQSVLIADFNNDSRMDVALANSGSHTITIFLGDGNYSFSNLATYSAGSKPVSIAVTQGTNNLGTFLGYDNGTFSNVTLMPMGYGSNPFCVLIGDFNDDRKLDFAVANEGTDSLSMFLQTC